MVFSFSIMLSSCDKQGENNNKTDQATLSDKVDQGDKEDTEDTEDTKGQEDTADQEDENKPVTEGVIYEIPFYGDGTYAIVSGYEGSATEVVIANEYEGLPVTKIKNAAFCRKTITSVFIPKSGTVLGLSTFSGCESLTSVTIPNSVEYLEYYYLIFNISRNA